MRYQHHSRYGRANSRPDYDRNDGKPGVVYILVNEAHKENLLKIGQSTRSGAHRANDLNRTVGTETPKLFKCVFEVATVDCGRAEKAVHERLKAYRLTSQEYFHVEFELAKQVISEECAKQVPAAPVKLVVKDAPTLPDPRKLRDDFLKERNLRAEIASKQAEWKKGVIQSKAAEGKIAGLKWGVTWFIGTWLLFGMMGAKGFVGWICLGFGLLVYNVAKDGPADTFLGSEEARNELAKMEEEIRLRSFETVGHTVSTTVASVVSPQIKSVDHHRELLSVSTSQGPSDVVEANRPNFRVTAKWQQTYSSGVPKEAPKLPVQAPVDTRLKAVCPKCKAALAITMKSPDLSRRIRCPTCSQVFLYGDGIEPPADSERVYLNCLKCGRGINLKQKPTSNSVLIRCPPCGATIPWSEYAGKVLQSRHGGLGQAVHDISPLDVGSEYPYRDAY